MYHFEKNIKNFLPEGPRENVWGPRENVSPGPAVALDGPGYCMASMQVEWLLVGHCYYINMHSIKSLTEVAVFTSYNIYVSTEKLGHRASVRVTA